MGIKRGVANMMQFLGNYYGTKELLKEKAKATASANAAKERSRILRGLREYSLWTNPNDPMRSELGKLFPGADFPIADNLSMRDWLKLRSQGGGGGGGWPGFPSNDVINVPE